MCVMISTLAKRGCWQGHVKTGGSRVIDRWCVRVSGCAHVVDRCDVNDVVVDPTIGPAHPSPVFSFSLLSFLLLLLHVLDPVWLCV